MNESGTAWGKFLRTAVAIIAMPLVPVSASAHNTGDRLVLAEVCTEAGHDAISAFKTDRASLNHYGVQSAVDIQP